MNLLGDVATMVVGGGMVALGAAAVALSRRQAGQGRRSPHELWDRLCRAHRLSRRERRVLRRAAERAGLDPAAMVFVEPAVVRAAAESQEDGKTLAVLERRLFG